MEEKCQRKGYAATPDLIVVVKLSGNDGIELTTLRYNCEFYSVVSD